MRSLERTLVMKRTHVYAWIGVKHVVAFLWRAFASVFRSPEAFVALLALGLTVYVARATVYQNKVQSAPSLQFRSMKDSEVAAGCGPEKAPKVTATSQTLCLQNSGQGPALLTGFDVAIDSYVVNFNGRLAWSVLGNPLMNSGVDIRQMVPTELSQYMIVKAGEEIALLRWPTTDGGKIASGIDLDQKYLKTGRIAVGICYCNFYDDCYYASSGEPKRLSASEKSCRNKKSERGWFRNLMEPAIERRLIEGNA